MQWSRWCRQRAILSLGLISLLVGAPPSFVVPTNAAANPGHRDAAIRIQAEDDRESSAPNRPNIILIVTDDQEVSSLTSMPNVQSLLQAQGTTFSRFFVSMAACCPSRASILRGQYAHNHGVLSNVGEQGGFKQFYDSGREDSTIATWLQSADYRTALLGKYLNEYPEGAASSYVPPGWDEWSSSRGYFDYQMVEDGEVRSYGKSPEDYSTDVLSRKATDFVRRSAAENRPFFLYLAPFAPHAAEPEQGGQTLSQPIPAPRHAEAFADARAPRPPSFDEADVTDKPYGIRNLPRLTPNQIAQIDELYRQRLRTLLAVDEMVASLIDALRETRTLEHTYVIFTSDNGHFLGEHRRPDGKGLPYEEAIRVPFVVRGPGVTAARVEDRLALNVDLAPTLAELAGVDVPDFVDGRSLAPLLLGEPPNSWRRSFLVEGQNLRFLGLRSEDLLYVEYRSGERELYDLRSDPYQLESLALVSDPAALAKLSAQLASIASCAAATCRAAEEVAVEFVDFRTARTVIPDADATVLEVEPRKNFGKARPLTVVDGGPAETAEQLLAA
jgi:arylsulfatase A-like enzyme